MQNKLATSNKYDPHSKVDGANMGPTWARQDPGGPHVGPMNFAIWGVIRETHAKFGDEMENKLHSSADCNRQH